MAVSDDELELFYDLCCVWNEGPMAQSYVSTRRENLIPHAAAEVREAILTSVYAEADFSQDHIELTRRLELNYGSGRSTRPTRVELLVQRGTAKVRRAIRSMLTKDFL